MYDEDKTSARDTRNMTQTVVTHTSRSFVIGIFWQTSGSWLEWLVPEILSRSMDAPYSPNFEYAEEENIKCQLKRLRIGYRTFLTSYLY